MLFNAMQKRDNILSLYESKFVEAYGRLPANEDVKNWPHSEIVILITALDKVIESNNELANELLNIKL